MAWRIGSAALIVLLVCAGLLLYDPDPRTELPGRDPDPTRAGPPAVPEPVSGEEEPEPDAPPGEPSVESDEPKGEHTLIGRIVYPAGVRLENLKAWIRTPMAVRGNLHRYLEIGPGGILRATGLPANRYAVAAWGDSAEGRFSAGVYADVPGPEVVLVLSLEPKPDRNRWRYRFLRPDGSPIDEGKIHVVYVSESSLQRAERRIEDGILELESGLTVDRMFVEIPAPGDGPGRGAVLAGPFPPGGPDRVLRMIPGLSLEGAVTPPARVEVRAVPARHPLPDDAAGYTATSDDSGRFRLDGLGDEPHRLTFEVPGSFVPVPPVTARPGESVRVRLVTAVTATLEVRGENDEPLADVPIYVKPMDDSAPDRRGGETDEAGRVVLDRLDPAKKYRLTVDCDEPYLEEGVEDWAPGDTRIQAVRGRLVEGVVHDRSGAPVPGALVHLRRPGEAEWRREERAWRKGWFTFDLQRPGTWELGVQIGGPRAPVNLARQVEAGEKDVVVVADAGRLLRVVIENWGKRYETVTPRLTEEGGTTRLHGLHDDDRLCFTGLAPGKTYTLWFGPFFDGMLVYEKGVPADREEIRVKLRQGGVIRGKVLRAEGPVRKQVDLVARGADFGARGRVEPDGTFKIPGVPEGEWTVIARVRIDGVEWSASARARAGETVELTLTPPAK